MKAFIKGVAVEGTPEEILKLMNLENPVSNLNDSKTKDYVFSFDRYYTYSPCSNCPNYGKGPCHCTIPYMTSTGWQYRPDVYYSTTSTSTNIGQCGYGSFASTEAKGVNTGAAEK